MNKTYNKMQDWLKRNENVRTLIIIVLLVLCAIEVRALAIDLADVYKAQKYDVYEDKQLSQSGKILTTDDIEPWMTFSYINFIFKMPASYIKDSLSINDSQYPNIHIERYIRRNNLDQAQFLLKIKTAVSAYKP